MLGRRRLIELRRAGYNIELSAPLDNIPFSTSSERERIEETVCLNIVQWNSVFNKKIDSIYCVLLFLHISLPMMVRTFLCRYLGINWHFLLLQRLHHHFLLPNSLRLHLLVNISNSHPPFYVCYFNYSCVPLLLSLSSYSPFNLVRGFIICNLFNFPLFQGESNKLMVSNFNQGIGQDIM